MSFLDRHRPGDPLVAPNAWDLGSARVLASLGFAALGTTSSGLGVAHGVRDGAVGCDAMLANARAMAEATGLPVTVDLEDGYAPDPEGVRDTFGRARALGVAGASIEDWDGTRFRGVAEATERVATAIEACGDAVVLTARADNYFHGVEDLADTIARLQSFADAGAHVVYAPGLRRVEDVRAVVASVGVPVNALLVPGGPTVAELAEAGVARITVGGSFAFSALGALAELATQLRDHGTLDGRLAALGKQAARDAFPA